MEKTQFKQAVERYKRALEHWDLPSFHYNLAIAQFNLGRDLDALRSLEKAMRYGEAALEPDRFREAEKLKAQIERRLARIVIECVEPGARVLVDNKLLFEGPGTGEAVVDAGPHTVVAQKRGYLTWEAEVAVVAGEHKPVSIDGMISSEPGKERRWVWWKPWTVVATGTGLLLGGSIAHALGARDFRTFDREFADLECANEDVIDAPPHVGGCRDSMVGGPRIARLARAERERAAAFGMYAVGGATLVTGLVLAYLNRETTVPLEAYDNGPESGAVSTRLSATVAPGEIRASLRLEF